MSLASHHWDIIVEAFDYLQVPLATEMLEGPTTSLTLLGICLDTVHMEARLPDTRFQNYVQSSLNSALFVAQPSQSLPLSWANSPLLQQWSLPAGHSSCGYVSYIGQTVQLIVWFRLIYMFGILSHTTQVE